MITVGSDPHTILSVALQRCTVRGREPVIVRSRLSSLHAKSRLIRLLFVGLALPLMVFDIWTVALRGKPVVVREFWNVPLAVVSPLLWPLRQRIWFNLNHNLSGLPQRFPAALKCMATMGFRFFLFDGSAAARHFPAQVLPAFRFPLFPCASGAAARALCSPPVLAVVGDFRAEKGNPERIRMLLKDLSKDARWTLKVGQHGNKAALFGSDDGISVVNTSSHADYLSFLSAADAVLVFADASKYYVRHSGTVMDAIACGAIPIVPNLPVIASQVRHPEAVGITYGDLSDVKKAVAQALAERESFDAKRQAYFKARNTIELTETFHHD